MKKGERVRVTCGELEGIENLFQEMRGEDRALILLDMPSRQVFATVPLLTMKVA